MEFVGLMQKLLGAILWPAKLEVKLADHNSLSNLKICVSEVQVTWAYMKSDCKEWWKGIKSHTPSLAGAVASPALLK